MEKSGNPASVVTPEFRVSYPHVHKPHQVMGKGDPKYSITMLFKKTDDLSALKLAIKHAKMEKYGSDKSDWPDDLLSPVVDGDLPKYEGKEGYKGHWVIKATSNQDNKPSVVGPDVDPDTGKLEVLTEPSQLYPGCYARAQVFARAWEYMGRQGIHFILDGVQKTRDGKSFGGRKTADEVFGPVAAAGNDEEDESESFL